MKSTKCYHYKTIEERGRGRVKVDTFSKSTSGVVREMNCSEERGDNFLLLAPLSIAGCYVRIAVTEQIEKLETFLVQNSKRVLVGLERICSFHFEPFVVRHNSNLYLRWIIINKYL